MAALTASTLSDLAVQLHEVFTSLMAAGFNESQSLTIVIGMARNGE